MIRWSDALARLQRSDEAHVLVSVIGTAGSVPRNTGSKMLVTATQLYDTIGGGNLELHAIEQARLLLQEGTSGQRLVKYPLAAALGQCCGGHATLLFESFCHASQSLWLFGAGHVGQALIQILQELPLTLNWVDSRAEQFPTPRMADIHYFSPADPVDVMAQVPASASVLIMTHCHDQDYRLCHQALIQQHQGLIGLIGSKTKAARFRHRLQHAGFDQNAIAQIESPVGLPQIGGKRPMEVAVSIAARVIQQYQTLADTQVPSTQLSLPELNTIQATLTGNPHDTE
ncbi:MAG: xanthine dehydrogenase accessory protein XdhC [Nitrincola lacisaponensis]|uniref:xanthine dehydrogenase accessory protein XdhC n=1 Tax=Nitrincola lacisaponensis TaxID=267850 RepID=UPI00391A4EBF